MSMYGVTPGKLVVVNPGGATEETAAIASVNPLNLDHIVECSGRF